MARLLVAIALLLALAIGSASAQPPAPAYIVVGDSIEAGSGDDIPGDGTGYVPLVALSLAGIFGQAPAVFNAAVPFAQTRDIWRTQLPAAIPAAAGHVPVVVSWGGGGNDLAAVVTGPQAAVCGQTASCLGRLNGLLNEVEQTIDRTIRELRASLGPEAVIFMRTQYNALVRPGCATAEAAAVGNVALEGLPGSVLDRGLNDRIRSVAGQYGAQVVDLFVPFALQANTLVSTDCIHPNGLGYQLIAALTAFAFPPP